MGLRCIFCGRLKDRRNDDKDLSFFRLPSEPGIRKLLWLDAIGSRVLQANDRICGGHFLMGRPSNDRTHPDFIPHLHIDGTIPPPRDRPLSSKELYEKASNEADVKTTAVVSVSDDHVPSVLIMKRPMPSSEVSRPSNASRREPPTGDLADELRLCKKVRRVISQKVYRAQPTFSGELTSDADITTDDDMKVPLSARQQREAYHSDDQQEVSGISETEAATESIRAEDSSPQAKKLRRQRRRVRIVEEPTVISPVPEADEVEDEKAFEISAEKQQQMAIAEFGFEAKTSSWQSDAHGCSSSRDVGGDLTGEGAKIE